MWLLFPNMSAGKIASDALGGWTGHVVRSLVIVESVRLVGSVEVWLPCCVGILHWIEVLFLQGTASLVLLPLFVSISVLWLLKLVVGACFVGANIWLGVIVCFLPDGGIEPQKMLSDPGKIAFMLFAECTFSQCALTWSQMSQIEASD